MGKRGPAPKPTALRLLHGETKSDRLNFDEPIPDRGIPDCPDDVSDEVHEVWDYTVRQIDVMGMSSRADRDALRCYCEAVVVHRKASVLVAKLGIIIKATPYTTMRNPAVIVQRDAAHTIRQWAQQFGLTPAARSDIRSAQAGAQRASDDSPFGATGL